MSSCSRVLSSHSIRSSSKSTLARTQSAPSRASLLSGGASLPSLLSSPSVEMAKCVGKCYAWRSYNDFHGDLADEHAEIELVKSLGTSSCTDAGEALKNATFQSNAVRRLCAELRTSLENNASNGAADGDPLTAWLQVLRQKQNDCKRKVQICSDAAAESSRKLTDLEITQTRQAHAREIRTKNYAETNPLERIKQRALEARLEQEERLALQRMQLIQQEKSRALNEAAAELSDLLKLLGYVQRAKVSQLTAALSTMEDGTLARSCVRQLLLLNVPDVEERLMSAPVALEPWMRRVMVTCCALELKILRLQEEVKRLSSSHSEDIARNWDANELTKSIRPSSHMEAMRLHLEKHPNEANGELMVKKVEVRWGDKFEREASEELKVARNELVQHRKLLADTRDNIAAALQNRMLRAKGGKAGIIGGASGDTVSAPRFRMMNWKAVDDNSGMMSSAELSVSDWGYGGQTDVEWCSRVLQFLTSKAFAAGVSRKLQRGVAAELSKLEQLRLFTVNAEQLKSLRGLGNYVTRVATAKTAMHTTGGGREVITHNDCI